MARALDRLSARFVATCTKPGRHADGGGLYLAIAPNGSRKRWTFFYKRAGKQREMGLGPASSVSLAEARRKADAARRLLADGIDPLEAKRAAEKPSSVPTFGDAADAHIAAMAPSWRNSKHEAQWRMTLSRVRDGDGRLTADGYSTSLRDKPVDHIDTAAVLAVLSAIWNDKPETAARLRGRIEAVLDAATAAGHRAGPNPARWKGHLSVILPKPKKLARGHHPAMPWAQLPAFVGKLRLVRGMGALALEFLVLTAARSGEVREARWREIDLARELWTVPAERMKAGREHRVPLTSRAVEILHIVAQLRPAGDNGDALVFPSSKHSRPLSDMTLTAVLRRHAGGEFTAHGFRSSFRDWVGDATAFPREVAEAALAHLSGDAVERAYRRGDALEKRREMMAAWAKFVTAPPARSGNETPKQTEAAGT
ncbi:tyrosine-type recombinase/integrase [Ancylobacter pratisalsi]|uniref:Tyrosine-type recombinase/integrase n=1 Tax=Ancylobacter pratisalsi TaxID=1745854 RepID=A0A6P1YQT5_9HYPH|nr:site-specific integrase [Ancylobacter pratisalsi]QIB35818.1 tyrosine-type recombinase/integrase [Ancylobacter pratisalsi]